MVDHKSVKLGKQKPKYDDRTFELRDFLTPSVPPLPPALDWSKGWREWGMMLNDNLGDCIVALCGHAVQVWTGNIGACVTLTNADILVGYEKWCGYAPGDPTSDQGGVMLSVFNQWHKHALGSQKLWAYADSGLTLEGIKRTIQLFGVAGVGAGLPITAQGQETWSVVGDPRSDPDSQPYSWGGHAFAVVGWDDAKKLVKLISWGEIYYATYEFITVYADESWALIGRAWVPDENAQTAPSGFDFKQLNERLANLGGDVVVDDKNKKKKRKK